MTPVRVALSNDYRIVLSGLAAMLEPYRESLEVVELTTERETDHPVDVILYDTFGRLPGEDEKLRRIVSANDAKVIVYSWDSYPVDTALARGAAGYIHKGLPPDELVAAILAIQRGEEVESPSANADETVDDGTTDDDTMPTWPGQEAGLSARESEILTFIARGLSNEEIARRAFLSINTIKTYIRSAYRKIEVTNRAQAVRWALTNGFAPD